MAPPNLMSSLLAHFQGEGPSSLTLSVTHSSAQAFLSSVKFHEGPPHPAKETGPLK